MAAEASPRFRAALLGSSNMHIHTHSHTNIVRFSGILSYMKRRGHDLNIVKGLKHQGLTYLLSRNCFHSPMARWIGCHGRQCRPKALEMAGCTSWMKLLLMADLHRNFNLLIGDLCSHRKVSFPPLLLAMSLSDFICAGNRIAQELPIMAT
jgi:hypothetical protein